METEFYNLIVKSFNDNNDRTGNFQGDEEGQRDNGDIITKNNIPYHSKTTVHSSQTDAFIEKLKGLFMDNIITINNEKLIERCFDARLNRKIINNVVLAVDKIPKDYITSLNNPTLWDINVAIYTVAITARQYNNDLKKIPAGKKKQNPINNLGGLQGN